jgi:hypothetical protein
MIKNFSAGYFYRTVVRLFFLLALYAKFEDCRAQQFQVAMHKQNAEYTLLGMIGYNYTDRHIANYSLNAADGGDVIMSSSTSGGSGTACCLKLSNKKHGILKVKVRWQVDGCIYLVKDDLTGKGDKVRYYYYKEMEVGIQRTPDMMYKYVETHFYPDGSVQVLLTKNMSSPRFVLDEKRPDKSFFSRCKNDQKPEE